MNSRRDFSLVLIAALLLGALMVPGAAVPDNQDTLALTSQPNARFRFGGLPGRRIAAGAENWLLPAPAANPGMVDMFRLRDRKPSPNLVPWAGEFAGKYLIGAIQTLRMTDDARLARTVTNFVAELVATQAEDGYLGPFPKETRLKANWDLWGHYHCMLGLLMWHEVTADPAALAACRRAADLVCRTFLDNSLRAFDAGSHEMNLAIIHGLGRLYRLTGEPRYLRMMREIEKDWERAGDYLRTGLAGKEFYQTPRPRWESLHDLQGLLELYRITGEERYRDAFEHHWRSIRRWDQRNTGGFSSGEQATGNPYAPTAIETCCTIAWMALSVDMLSLTADPQVADELELATCNAWAGAQHPSGRWCTYSTPMDGAREASAHAIVFQARAGTPELNCCSVNGPRGWGMLSEWSVMSAPDGLAVNYLGPGSFEGKLPDGAPIRLVWHTDYPLSGSVRLRVEPATPRQFRLRLRIPGWAVKPRARVNAEMTPPATSGTYLALDRRWQQGDVVELEFDMPIRSIAGDREQRGKVSLYRGPLLLAWDQRFSAFDETDIPVVDLRRLGESTVEQAAAPAASAAAKKSDDTFAPWLRVGVEVIGGRNLLLCDYASAGATGSRYRSWLSATPLPPPPSVTHTPLDGASIPPGLALFRWDARRDQDGSFRMVVSETPTLNTSLVEVAGITSNRLILSAAQSARLLPGRWYYWGIAANNAHGVTWSTPPPARFRINDSLPPLTAIAPPPPTGPNGELVTDDLRGNPAPKWARVTEARGLQPALGPGDRPDESVELDGVSGRITYALDHFPDEDYSMAVWARITRLPDGRLGQIMSAWVGPMDDPLRLCTEKGRLFARIEAGQGYSTEGVPVAPERWHHLAVVKAGTRLTLYVDGKAGGSAEVPLVVRSAARDFALGGNPHYTGNEFLAVRLSGVALYGRALSASEVEEAARRR